MLPNHLLLNPIPNSIMRSLLSLLILLFVSSLSAQEPAKILIDTEGSVHPWNHLEVNNAPEQFQFAIVTDRTGGVRPGVFPQAVEKLNLLQPEFVMSVGDLITGYTADTAEIEEQWQEFTGFIDQLQMPFFYVPGNHDYINDVMEYKWLERFGKAYYHFVYQDVLFVCLNSEERKRGAGRGYIGETQIAYLDSVLQENEDVKWTLLFMHQPLWDQEDNGLWAEAEALLKDRKHSVFVGHRHRYVKYERNNGKYFILATTGGGSSLRGPSFGEFDHVVWVTMTEDGPLIANLMLDGIWDENVNTEGYYAFARPLMDGNNLSLSPLFHNEALFAKGKLALKLQNPSDVPMVADLQFESNGTLWAAMDQWHDTLPPNTTRNLNLPLRTEQAMAMGDIQPVRIQGTYTYLPDQQPQLAVEQVLRVGPERLRSLVEAPKKVKVDGNRKEWPELPFSISDSSPRTGSPFAHQGPDDLSARWGCSYDKNGLYLLAEVRDDQLEIDSLSSPYRQDGIWFVLDARDKQLSSLNKGRNREYTLAIGISPSIQGDDEGHVFQPSRLPEGTQTHCVKTEKGYRVEVSVPMDYLVEQAGGNWQNLRLNVFVSDYDQMGEHETRHYWQAAWEGIDNEVGSGMFEVK
jgi:predicted phosphodiesterase